MNLATAIIPGAECSGNLIQPTNQYVMYQPRIENITIIMPGQGESQKGGDNQTDDNWMSMGIPSCVIQEMRMPKLPINRTVSQEETLQSIFKYGCPESNVPLIKKGHYIWFDKQTRLAKMVAYRLTKDDIEGNCISVFFIHFKSFISLMKVTKYVSLHG